MHGASKRAGVWRTPPFDCGSDTWCDFSVKHLTSSRLVNPAGKLGKGSGSLGATQIAHLS